MHLPGEVGEKHVSLYVTGAVCSKPSEVLESDQAVRVVQNFINDLRRRKSSYLEIFKGLETVGDRTWPSPAAVALTQVLTLLCDKSWQEVVEEKPELAGLLADPPFMARLVEELYDHWRAYERYIIFEAKADESRDHAIEGHNTFITTNEELNALIREAYRRIARNLRGFWPRVYRQVPAGTNMSLLVERTRWDCPQDSVYSVLAPIRMVRLALLVPPVTLYPRRNARQGRFKQIFDHPLEGAEFNVGQWLCLPLRVGELCIHFFFDREYLALAMSLVNLFEVAGHDEARRRPDGMVIFGIPSEHIGGEQTVFYVDEEQDMVIGAVAKSEDVDYFGYCKKMTLTIHNVIMMRRGNLPLHGAMARIHLRHGPEFAVVIVGDSGAGKSETLEAFRVLADEWISDITIIFDDMGTLQFGPNGEVKGYGTEIGAFVRLDDLAPGYAFGHFDRSIFMNPHRQNARVVVPIAEYTDVVAGDPVNMLLYANNYENVSDEAPVLDFFTSPDAALEVFRAGYRAAKGTTDERGLVRTYFANPFGGEQLQDMHEPLAKKYFEAAFATGVQVGQLRTRLGIEGWEQDGPRLAAEELFRTILHDQEQKK